MRRVPLRLFFAALALAGALGVLGGAAVSLLAMALGFGGLIGAGLGRATR